MSSTLGCNATVRSPQVGEVVGDLRRQIETLENRFAELASRLEPVLKPPYPRECTTGDIPSLVPLADDISRATRRLVELDNFLFELLDRLEV